MKIELNEENYREDVAAIKEAEKLLKNVAVEWNWVMPRHLTIEILGSSVRIVNAEKLLEKTNRVLKKVERFRAILLDNIKKHGR